MIKKTYKRPAVIKLKSINSITKAVTNQGRKDGGIGKNHAS